VLPSHFSHSAFVELIDLNFEKILEEKCREKDIPFHEVFAVMIPERKTLLTEYQDELRRLKKKDAETFVRKWKWVGTHLFGGEPLTREKVLIALENVSHEEPIKQDKREKYDAEIEKLISIGQKLV